MHALLYYMLYCHLQILIAFFKLSFSEKKGVPSVVPDQDLGLNCLQWAILVIMYAFLPSADFVFFKLTFSEKN